MSAPAVSKLPHIGLFCNDPLRVAGLQVLLEHGVRYRVTHLEGVRARDLIELEVMLIDATATEHLFALIAAVRRIRPQVRLLVLGLESDEAHTEAVIGAGAQGYLCHVSGEAELESALEVVRSGSIWAPRRVLARLLEQARGTPDQHMGTAQKPNLTAREAEVLRLLVQGRSNREIGTALRISESTVKSHLARLMRKTGVLNRTALTMRALDAGWTAASELNSETNPKTGR